MAKKRKKAALFPAHVLRLYKAAAHYVKKCGGSVILASGVQVQQWPGSKRGEFVLGIKCLGRKPTYSDGSPSGDGESK